MAFEFRYMEQFIVSARKYRPQTFKRCCRIKGDYQYFCAIESNHLASALLHFRGWKNNLCSYFGSKDQSRLRRP
jgi:hypothetical protein